MADFDPERLLRTLERRGVAFVLIGGVAARVEGAPILTEDLDITPARGTDNLERLAAALIELGARLRVGSQPEGLPFPVGAAMLATAESWTLTTDAGDLDLVFAPAGTGGFDDLRRSASPREIADRLVVLVASLADVIRSKQASGRPKDQAALPILRETLEAIRWRERRPPSS